jgi:hypothetical protein
VQELLGMHASVFTCRETHFFHRARRDGQRKHLDHLGMSPHQVQEAYNFICTHIELLGQYDPSQVRSLHDAALFFDGLMTSEARLRGKSVWVEKSTENRMYIPWIKREIPTAHFVHVLRDGRDVVASLVDAGTRYPERWKRYADLRFAIASYNEALVDSMLYCGRADHIFVQYEHILEDSEQVCRKLYAALDLEVKSARASLTELHRQVVRSDESWKNDHKGEIENTRLVKFNQVFSDQQKKLVSSRVKSQKPVDSTYI